MFGQVGFNQPCPCQAFLDRAADQARTKEPFVQQVHKLDARVRKAAVTSGSRQAKRHNTFPTAATTTATTTRPARPASGHVTSAMVRHMVPSNEWKVYEDLVNKRWLIRLPGCFSASRSFQLYTGKGAALECLRAVRRYGRFPKFNRIFLGRDPGTLKSDIVSKKHIQLICSDLRFSN